MCVLSRVTLEKFQAFPKLVVLIIVTIWMFGIGCGKREAQLTILCGGSFKDPVEKLADEFEKETGIDVEISFGQSEDHLPQVKEHKVGDIFITHSPYMKYTEDAQASAGWVHVGYVSPVLVVKKGNPHNLQRVEDLARPGLKVALPSPEFSTCGKMVESLFMKKGIWEDVMKNVENAFFRSHSQVATAIKVGNRDAGIMWNGVAHNWLDALQIVPTPYEYDEEIQVGIIGLSYSKNPKLVSRFLEFSKMRGTEIFTEFGYTK